MNDNFLQPIYNENDLLVYENFINSSNFSNPKNKSFLTLLKDTVGKKIKVYFAIGNQLAFRQGRLLAVYDDYLTISQNRERLAIKLCEIKFLSI